MGRPIVLSNGEMHVGLNESGLVHDFYFPYVGQENHVAASDLVHRVGVWVDGEFSWVDRAEWDIQLTYHDETLVGHVVAMNERLGVRLEFDDFVDSSQAAFVRNVEVANCHDKGREVRIFFHQVFVISNSRDSDTVQYVPEHKAILHYKGHRSFVVGAQYAGGNSFQDYCVGLHGIEGHQGTFMDAEDGVLSRNAVEHGQVDSVLELTCQLGAHDSTRVHYWIAGGKSQREAFVIHQRLQTEGALKRLLDTVSYWREWLAPSRHFAERLDADTQKLLARSLLTIKSHQDKRGALIASTDTTMLNYARDAYAYSWPRDGAYAMWPLIRLGFVDEPLHFFAFCRRALHEGGYLMHKYQADGSLGSSWHPYVHGESSSAPIQTDETASVLFMFRQYYAMHPDEKLLRDYYVTMVRPMANFLSGYIDHDGLPKPSYDLWEEKFLTSTYTTAVTHAALIAASELADEFGDADDALRWQTTGDDMRTGAGVFFDSDAGYLIKGFVRSPQGVEYDHTLDLSTLYGAYMFGLFEHGSKEIESTYRVMVDSLSSQDKLAFPRYTADNYNRITTEPNPWPICGLWMSQYAMGQGDRELAQRRLEFVRQHTTPSGILAEQLHPDSLEHVSVAPLVWSHAEYVSTILDIYGTKPNVEEAS